MFDANTNDQLNAGTGFSSTARRWTTSPKTVVNTVIPGGANIYELRDYSDENVYFLTAEPGARSRRLATRSAPPNLTTPATKFDAVAHVETDNIFRPLGGSRPLVQRDDAADHAAMESGRRWGPQPDAAGAASGAGFGHRSRARRRPVSRGLTEDPTCSPITSRESRCSMPRHQPLNPPNNDDGTFDGRTIYTHDFTWTLSRLGRGAHEPGAGDNRSARRSRIGRSRTSSFLDFVEVGYKRTFQASGRHADVRLSRRRRRIPGYGSDDQPSGGLGARRAASARAASSLRFASPAARVGGSAGNFSVRFHMSEDPAIPDGTPRRFVVAGTNGVDDLLRRADFTRIPCRTCGTRRTRPT